VSVVSRTDVRTSQIVAERTARTLLINVGNTHVSYVGCEQGRVIGKVRVVPVAQAQNALELEAEQSWFVCSVVPALLDELHHLQPDMVQISPSHASDVDWGTVDLSTYGLDRVANVIAGRALGRGAVAIIDIGTAVTVDVVDESGVLLGGVILPGRQLQRKALNDYTAQLPLVGLNSELPLLGTSTRQAISSGIDLAIANGVAGILGRIKAEAAIPSLSVLATGGDMDFFAAAIPGFAISERPYLTLEGMARAAEAAGL